MTRDEFFKKYDEEHKCCPKCGNERYSTTFIEYPLNLEHPDEYKDKNDCTCSSCGDKHITHDRISKSDIIAKLTSNYPEKIKLYHFNPNTYDLEFFVAETSKEKAYNSLIKHLKLNSVTADYPSFYEEHLERWKLIDINNSATYPYKYTLEEYDIGEVIGSEIA